MDSKLLRYVGESLYHLDIIKEYKRYVVFRARVKLNSSKMEKFVAFFEATPERKTLMMGNPSFIEQVTRSFFYKNSKLDERIKLVQEHVEILEGKFNNAFFEAIYEPAQSGRSIKLWEMDTEEKNLSMCLEFHPGQRKEGCLALVVRYGEEYLYQIMFWAAKDKEGKPALFVGALQGPQNMNEEIKLLTKKCFGYRPKNLVFYGLRSFAKVLGMNKIYAVTSEGYFAMTGIRTDRKLKVDFSDFWKECEGVPCEDDKRFYVMPVAEYRKDMSELKPSKRAQHRRRFEMLDNIDASVAGALDTMSK
ncbi:MAG: VirK/YbjX family protein [Phascolarctobacterium sp.]|nr:VirK/YbjX family protein [Phascolarctobacterium sp.]